MDREVKISYGLGLATTDKLPLERRFLPSAFPKKRIVAGENARCTVGPNLPAANFILQMVDHLGAVIMNRLTRDIIVERTQNLLLRQGGLDVSLTSVLRACGANKGSLYHFFPDGKDELLVAAMERQAECALSSNKSFLARSDTTGEAIARLVRSFAAMIEKEDCPEFLPFSAAGAISDDSSGTLRDVCANTLNSLERLYAESLRKEGMPTKSARSLASVIVSTIEGALLQSRTRGTSMPLKNAAIHLRGLIDAHTKS